MTGRTRTVSRPSLGRDTVTEAFRNPALVPDVVEDIGARMVFVADAMRQAGDTNGMCPICGRMQYARRELLSHLVHEHQINHSYLEGAEALERWERAAHEAEEFSDAS